MNIIALQNVFAAAVAACDSVWAAGSQAGAKSGFHSI